jgi:hypothetical protein
VSSKVYWLISTSERLSHNIFFFFFFFFPSLFFSLLPFYSVACWGKIFTSGLGEMTLKWIGSLYRLVSLIGELLDTGEVDVSPRRRVGRGSEAVYSPMLVGRTRVNVRRR